MILFIFILKASLRVLAKFDLIYSQYLYCIASPSLCPLTLESILLTKVDKEDSEITDKAKSDATVNDIKKSTSSVEKQLMITQFLPQKLSIPKLARVNYKNTNKITSISNKSSCGRQSSVTSYVYKKKSWQPNQKWLDKLKLEFEALEASVGSSESCSTFDTQAKEFKTMDSDEESFLNIAMDEIEAQNRTETSRKGKGKVEEQGVGASQPIDEDSIEAESSVEERRKLGGMTFDFQVIEPGDMESEDDDDLNEAMNQYFEHG